MQKSITSLGRCILGFVGLGVWNNQATAQDESKKTPLSTLSDGSFLRQLPLLPTTPVETGTAMHKKTQELYNSLPFGVGERLRFAISYLGIKGGQAEILVQQPVLWKSHFAHRFTGEAQSADWFSWVISLYDSIESLALGTPEVEPLRFYINQRENTFLQSKIISFNWDVPKIFQKYKRAEKDAKEEAFELVPGVKDAAAALYYLRSLLFYNKINDTVFEFPIFTSEKTWTARAKKIGTKDIKVGNRLIATDVLELSTHFGGLMEQKGHMKLWMSRDASRIPIYIEADIKFGHIDVSLIAWDPPHAPHPVSQLPAISLKP